MGRLRPWVHAEGRLQAVEFSWSQNKRARYQCSLLKKHEMRAGEEAPRWGPLSRMYLVGRYFLFTCKISQGRRKLAGLQRSCCTIQRRTCVEEGNPELLNGWLGPKRNKNGEATRQNSVWFGLKLYFPSRRQSAGTVARNSQRGGVSHCSQLSPVLNIATCWEVRMTSIAPGLQAGWIVSPIFMDRWHIESSSIVPSKGAKEGCCSWPLEFYESRSPAIPWALGKQLNEVSSPGESDWALFISVFNGQKVNLISNSKISSPTSIQLITFSVLVVISIKMNWGSCSVFHYVFLHTLYPKVIALNFLSSLCQWTMALALSADWVSGPSSVWKQDQSRKYPTFSTCGNFSSLQWAEESSMHREMLCPLQQTCSKKKKKEVSINCKKVLQKKLS